MNRRLFLSTSVSTGMALASASSAFAEGGGSEVQPSGNKTIFLIGDGLSQTPAEYAATLAQETKQKEITSDNYSRDGVISQIEKSFAADLGKERAIYLPTGTMANHLAMRILTNSNSYGQRAIVPAESHLYNDSGDCCQQLSGITLVPLAKGKACFSLEELKSTIEGYQADRVAVPVTALLVESPVRRQNGELVPYEEIKAICQFASEVGIRTHLDGARLYIASAYTRISPKDYASLFDTVFVSLNKYFNAGSGAILAGSAELIDGLYQTRRMLGGSLSHAWPFATMALAYKEGFIERLQQAIATSEQLIANLEKSQLFTVRRIPNGSNIFAVTPTKTNAKQFREKLAQQQIETFESDPKTGEILMRVNETMNRTNADSLTKAFLEAAAV